MSIPDELSLIDARRRAASAELYAEEFAKAVRALLDAPLGSHESRDAIIRCRAVLTTYEAEDAPENGARQVA